MMVAVLLPFRSFVTAFQDVGEAAAALHLSAEHRAQTGVDDLTPACLEAGRDLELVLKNSGTITLSEFADWDVVAHLQEPGGVRVVYLDYTESATPGANQWTNKGIYSNAEDLTAEISEPGRLNASEEMTVLLNLAPDHVAGSDARVILTTANGISAYASFEIAASCGYFFHADEKTINGTDYYRLKRVPGDGPATTVSATFTAGQTGRVRPSSNSGKFVFPLTGISQIPADTWQVSYRVKRDEADRGGFVWFTNATDISLTTTGSWQDIDLSSHVPVSTTGAIVEVLNTGTSSDYSAVLRGKEDTRDYMSNALYQEIEGLTHRWQVVKVDGNRLIQGYTESTEIDFKLLGYTTGADPSYFATPVDVTPASTGVWTAVDVSGSVDADADGVMLFIDSISSADRDYGIREVGSSYAITNLELEEYGNTMFFVGLNASDQFDAYIEDSDVKIYLVGQTKGSVVYYTDDIAVTDPATGSWQEIDADDYGVAATATGLILAVEKNKKGDKRASFRHGDSTDDWGNGRIGSGTRVQSAVGINDANVWDAYIENQDIDIYIAAYTRLINLDVHADMDILVRKADGAIRATLATDTANTATITSTVWQTYTASHVFPGYTVVDQTDYLEIDLFAESVTNGFTQNVTLDFRIDDAIYPISDQTGFD